MAFKRVIKPNFTAQVKYDLPGDNGERITGEFTGIYLRLPQEEVDQLLTKGSAGKVKDQEVVDKAFRGWGNDVLDENDQPWPYNEDNLKAFLQENVGMRACIVKAFFDNYVLAPAKNSGAPPATS